ncbi:AAA family ATPase [Dellaglioa algida]|uniref:Atp-dependent dna helicase n=1 Tax=Dellaglioa algida DSM 15638 TaxID=1423719 RepID=A0A0R1HMD1_9LACO|nr:RNA polymerase recycling motor HelD [Dellaglioa algida]KRK45603.1 atp-dependent dna helicase [Dellaglioa algida DSM 15638]MDK1733128.1 AAA family ATPase [Dellaglioa algida]MDK1734610.1 AAA family ATPase [Dellaglioa algida]
MADKIKIEEQAHLDDVIIKIKDAEVKRQNEIKYAENEARSINGEFTSDVHINTTTYTGMIDTAMSVRQQQQMLAERETSWKNATSRLDILKKLENKPYFARLNIQEGNHKKETIYIGLGSFADRPEHFMVYDWRAPISSVYYDGGLGDVTYQTPDGDQTVDVSLKRQFVIDDGQIETIFDTDEAVGDQMLLDVLNDSADTKMKSIVTTIQKEQNQIIRDVKAELLFVQGAAGSGKTSAVLQRVAYLLYRYRGNLTASQVVLFSPNQLFNDYIDQVLPELGEQNMVQMTYFQYASRRLPNMQVETLQERFEEDNTTAKKHIQVLKNSLAFFNASMAYSEHLEQADMKFRDIKFNDEIFISKDKIKSIYYKYNENYHLRTRLEATRESLVKLLNRRIEAEAKLEWVEKAIQDMSKEQLNALYGDQDREFASGDKEMRFLTRTFVMRQFTSVHKAIVRNRFLNINSQYVNFLHNVPKYVNLSDYGVTLEEWQDDVADVVARLKTRQISMHDVTPYLYLFDRMTGKHGETDVRYVFIDEIQDYTAFQLAFLKEGFPRAKFTLLGDLNQAIFTKENSKSLLSELGHLFPADKTKVVQLTKSYRSTQQITDFTKEVLINGESVTSFNRQGDLPTITVDKNSDKLVQDLENQLAKNVDDHLTTAIIAKSLAECTALYNRLQADDVPVTLIKTENQRLAEGTIIVPAFLAKGLEFDAVVMWGASKANYHEEDERQLVYTICSRAMHRLNVYAEIELSPLFDHVSKALYILK